MARSRAFTIVIKLGTTSIVHETTHQPLLSTLSSIVETVLQLKEAGHRVVLVSSGAIGVGLRRMDIANRPKGLAKKQALAAIGQGRLIALWDNLFGQLGQPIAQVLLTRGDISDRTRYLNAINTFSELLSMGVVPIVNENDTVSVSEIKFGDNDTLSAITASMLHADYLFLLTDVDGLYTTNPRKDPDARPIDIVHSVQAIRAQVSTKTLGSKLGTGGMETKLIAAEIATAAGVTVVISSSRHPENIRGIIEYDAPLRAEVLHHTSPTREHGHGWEHGPSDAALAAGEGERDEDGQRDRTPGLTTPTPATLSLPPTSPLPSRSSSTPTPPATSRPPHTVFLPSPTPLSDVKAWTSHALAPAGSVIVDAGAHAVLARRESGGRLLPAGVRAVIGAFAAGQAVRILVRKSGATVGAAAGAGVGTSVSNGTAIAAALAEHAAAAAFAVAAAAAHGSVDGSPAFTQPSTPMLLPAESMMSSISTLDPLPEPAGAIGEEHDGADDASESEGARIGGALMHGGEEVIEVGRGLASYNSEQIGRVKGLRSSNIAQILGYADSEYVVENISIRIPPFSLA